MPLTFLHTADWQLGKPFARVTDPDKRGQLRKARVDAVRNLAPLVERTGARFVLVAGDLFDSSTADKATVAQACDAIASIPVPVIVIPGNHDHGGAGCLWDQDFFRRHVDGHAANLVVLRTPEPHLRVDAIILPAPLQRQHTAVDPTSWIRELPPALREDPRPRIVLAHGSVLGFSSAGGDDGDGGDPGVQPNVLMLDRLPMPELDYVALGDWHGTKQVEAKAWYAGAVEQDRHAKGDDYRAGRALVVTVSRDIAPVVREERVGVVAWHRLQHQLLGDRAVDHFQELLSQVVGEPSAAVVLDLTLDGALPPAELERLRHAVESLEARLLHCTVDNRVALSPSPEEIGRLVNPVANPVIAQVAAQLVERARGSGDDAHIAQLALEELVLHLRTAGVAA